MANRTDTPSQHSLAPALSAAGVSVQLGGQPVLHDVQLQLQRGRWTSIIGPNGAGKSTLLKALAGLLPLQGQVELLGQPFDKVPARERAKTMAWLGQSERALDDMTAFDTVMLGRMPHQNWLATASGQDIEIVRQVMQSNHVWQFKDRSLAELSGGERQRVMLARVLAVQAPVVLMDEPLANLDPPHQTEWLLDMRALVQSGVSLVSVLHEVSIALQADDLVIVDKGRIKHIGACNDPATRAAVEAVFEHRIHVRQVGQVWTAVPNLQPLGPSVQADRAPQ
ncbi:ABC transporter ATP-binding protein [Lampropedia aestuarii]|uniref:ABC transporter ATP-binding protein n=1 Tax=Lampropedia aestuarii TaxID=2562762 RepID=UPI002468EC6D|nr:ABC transporter ATP-binding protein [Lampropedia aestuarii]MDH5857020.1 ABC transporter ATP-binding protein [Lampropedia aestuarii]